MLNVSGVMCNGQNDRKFSAKLKLKKH